MDRGWNSWVALALLAVAVTAWTDPPSEPFLYIDRAQWFQVLLPEGWLATAGRHAGALVTVQRQDHPVAHLTLALRPLPELPELVTREALLEQARAILRAVALRRNPAVVTDVTGWPMTGVSADYTDQAAVWQRVTVLMDVPRRRAFIWTASAPPDQFASYDVAFDQVAAGLIPALPEG